MIESIEEAFCVASDPNLAWSCMHSKPVTNLLQNLSASMSTPFRGGAGVTNLDCTLQRTGKERITAHCGEVNILDTIGKTLFVRKDPNLAWSCMYSKPVTIVLENLSASTSTPFRGGIGVINLDRTEQCKKDHTPNCLLSQGTLT